jgi:hypothetical protein
MQVTVLSDGDSFGMDVKLDRNAHVRDLAGRMRTFRSGHRVSVSQIGECVNNNYPQLIFLDSIPLGAYIPRMTLTNDAHAHDGSTITALMDLVEGIFSRPGIAATPTAVAAAMDTMRCVVDLAYADGKFDGVREAVTRIGTTRVADASARVPAGDGQ